MRRPPLRPADIAMTREEASALLEAWRARQFSASGQCLSCLPVQRRHRVDERL